MKIVLELPNGTKALNICYVFDDDENNHLCGSRLFDTNALKDGMAFSFRKDMEAYETQKNTNSAADADRG